METNGGSGARPRAGRRRMAGIPAGWLAAAALGIAPLSPLAADPPLVTLTLEGGAEKAGDVVLELAERPGGFEPQVWATAFDYNRGQHAGTAALVGRDGESLHLSVKLAIEGDAVAPAGSAAYDIRVTRRGDAFSGRYSGSFVDLPVTGVVHGAAAASPVREIGGFQALRPDEHPRLIFRKDDGPELRRRLETPVGKGILGMLTHRAPIRQVSQASDRRASWIAANWGAVHQLTADPQAAKTAREILMQEVVTKPLPRDRKDIHHATILLGAALAYDLCHDAWDGPFRCRMAEYLAIAAAELARGDYQGFALDAELIDPTPWKHRNAVRMACAGCTALAVLGDAGSDGKPLDGIESLARKAERHVTAYLQWGVTQSGHAPEGAFERDFALANGVLQFIQASRVARGRDLSGVNPYLLAGNILTAAAGGDGAGRFGLSSISLQLSGRWPMGLGAVPSAFLPAMKWCFDRDVGLDGARHFDCAFPYQAAYALANYPFGAAAEPPDASFPLMATDAVQGHFLFRNHWRDADDATVELFLNLKSMAPPPQRGSGLTTGVLNVSGFGTAWIRGFLGPPPLNDRLGARLLYAEVGRGQALLGMDLSRSFVKDPRRAGAPGRPPKKPGQKLGKELPTPADVRNFLNPAPPEAAGGPKDSPPQPAEAGPAVTRHLAVDFSGICGAPVLLVVVDRVAGAAGMPWQIPLAVPATPTADAQFVCGDPAGANLRGRFVIPAGARIAGRGIRIEESCFAVFTLQRGAPPAAAVEGAGLSARVTVGARTIRFDGGRIVLGGP